MLRTIVFDKKEENEGHMSFFSCQQHTELSLSKSRFVSNCGSDSAICSAPVMPLQIKSISNSKNG